MSFKLNKKKKKKDKNINNYTNSIILESNPIKPLTSQKAFKKSPSSQNLVIYCYYKHLAMKIQGEKKQHLTTVKIFGLN